MKTDWKNASIEAVGPLTREEIKEIIKKNKCLTDNIHGITLDYGCGTGRWYYGFKDLVDFDYLGVDISEKMLKELNRLYPKVLYPKMKHELITENKVSGKYDSIICYSVFTHMEKDVIIKLLKQFQEALVEGGVLFFSYFDKDVTAPHGNNWEIQSREFYLRNIKDFKLIDEFKIEEQNEQFQSCFVLKK